MLGLDLEQVERERRRKQLKACDRKEPFSRDRAFFMANALCMRPYRCPYCQNWHLTSRL